MPKISNAALSEIESALRQYREEIEESGLRLTVKATRYREVNTFVRWLKDLYTPGQGLPPERR